MPAVRVHGGPGMRRSWRAHTACKNQRFTPNVPKRKAMSITDPSTTKSIGEGPGKEISGTDLAQGGSNAPNLFRRPTIAIPIPTPSVQYQRVEAGVPDSQMTREATGLLREFSTPLLFNHSHRVFFWAEERGKRTEERFDVELLFISAAFHDMGLLKTFSSEDDRFEVDSANAVRQFLEHHGVADARIQTAWDAIALHTTPGIAVYKPIEVELLYNGIILDVLGTGYESFPADVRERVVAQYPRVAFKQGIADAFFRGIEHKAMTAEGTCNEDICSHFIRNYKRSNFYEQIQSSPFQNSEE
jgi:hypothetical protein